MSTENALALVLRTNDWSETSRIVTFWTREFGRVRALAKGGRRLRSNFENALDLLTVCSIVFIRKSSGAMDLLTEAQVVTRYPRLSEDLQALYGGYYLAELLSEHTQDYDPHPTLFDTAIETLELLGGRSSENSESLRPRRVVMRFEMQLLDDFGYRPTLDLCADCGKSPSAGRWLTFSAQAGGLVCPNCSHQHRDRRGISLEVIHLLQSVVESTSVQSNPWEIQIEAETRRVLSQYVTWHLGRRPRLLPYLEQGS